MKFSVLACAITGALAVNTNFLVDRDASTVTGILSNVKKNLEALDSAVKSYSGDKAPLLKASNTLISTLKDGKTKVDASSELSLDDAVTLTGPVKDLTKTGQGLADDLKAFKPTVEKEGECSLVRTQVGNVNDASQALIKAVVGKVPQEAQQIAQQLSAGLIQVLKDSVAEFNEQNCKDSGNGGSPSGGASTSAAAPPTGGASTSAGPAPTGADSTSVAPGTPTPTPIETPTAGGPSQPSGTEPPVVTAGAAHMAPLGAGAAALAAAALML